MEYEVIITRSALRDLEEIRAYIARDNPAAAQRFGLKLLDEERSHYASSRNEVGL